MLFKVSSVCMNSCQSHVTDGAIIITIIIIIIIIIIKCVYVCGVCSHVTLCLNFS